MSIRLLTAVAMFAAALFGQGPGPSGSTGTTGTSGGSGTATQQQVSLFIPNETAPPGGVAQMKFMVTEPTPISTGRPSTVFDPTLIDAVLGIELFNPSGDVNGVALVNGSHIAVQYITSSGAQGTDYPIMTMALHVRPDAVRGTTMNFGLDPSSTWTLSTLTTATCKPAAPAIVTAGGTVSIANVIPGGGLLPAGTVVSIQGIGFQPQTQVQLNAIKFSSIQVVGPQEIQFTLAADTNMTGQKIQVVNPDGSQDTYFSYLRGVPLGQSAQPLLANAVPVFSSMTYSSAVFNPVMPASATQFTGIAMQNPQLAAANVTVSLFSSTNALMGSSTFNLPSGNRMMREISELAQGAAPAFGSYLVVSSTQPVQVFGFVGDNTAGTVTPFTAVLTQP